MVSIDPPDVFEGNRKENKHVGVTYQHFFVQKLGHTATWKKLFSSCRVTYFWIKKVVVGQSNVIILFSVAFKNISGIDWYHLHHHRTFQATYMAGKWQKCRFFKIYHVKNKFSKIRFLLKIFMKKNFFHRKKFWW